MGNGPAGGGPRKPTALTATTLKPSWIYMSVLIKLGDGSGVYAVVVAAGPLRAPCAVVDHVVDTAHIVQFFCQLAVGH